MKIRYYRLVRLFIPVTVVLYLTFIPLNSVIERDHVEVFPFFSWKLFARTPDWDISKYTLIVNTIDGEKVKRTFYLIPSDNIRDQKALNLAARACSDGRDCDDIVAEVLYPIVFDALRTKNVQFSIVHAHLDLDEIQDNIVAIAARAASKTDFFKPHTVVGSWNTQVGRVG